MNDNPLYIEIAYKGDILYNGKSLVKGTPYKGIPLYGEDIPYKGNFPHKGKSSIKGKPW